MTDLSEYAMQLQETLEKTRGELALTKADRAFYKTCALSGEVPKEGDEPSAAPPEDHSTEPQGEK